MARRVTVSSAPERGEAGMEMEMEKKMEEVFGVFVDTNLDTHFALPVSARDTVAHVKEKIRSGHLSCFPHLGDIAVTTIMVKRKSHFYNLVDSMVMEDVFAGMRTRSFLSVEISLVDLPADKVYNQSHKQIQSERRLNAELCKQYSKHQGLICTDVQPFIENSEIASSYVKTDKMPSDLQKKGSLDIEKKKSEEGMQPGGLHVETMAPIALKDHPKSSYRKKKVKSKRKRLFLVKYGLMGHLLKCQHSKKKRKLWKRDDVLMCSSKKGSRATETNNARQGPFFGQLGSIQHNEINLLRGEGTMLKVENNTNDVKGNSLVNAQQFDKGNVGIPDNRTSSFVFLNSAMTGCTDQMTWRNSNGRSEEAAGKNHLTKRSKASEHAILKFNRENLLKRTIIIEPKDSIQEYTTNVVRDKRNSCTAPDILGVHENDSITETRVPEKATYMDDDVLEETKNVGVGKRGQSILSGSVMKNGPKVLDSKKVTKDEALCQPSLQCNKKVDNVSSDSNNGMKSSHCSRVVNKSTAEECTPSNPLENHKDHQSSKDPAVLDAENVSWKNVPKHGAANNLKRPFESLTDEKCAFGVSSNSPEKTPEKIEKEAKKKRKLGNTCHSFEEEAFIDKRKAKEVKDNIQTADNGYHGREQKETKRALDNSEYALDGLSSDANIPISKILKGNSRCKKKRKSSHSLPENKAYDTVMNVAGAEKGVNVSFHIAEACKRIDGMPKESEKAVLPSSAMDSQYNKVDYKKSGDWDVQGEVKADGSKKTGSVSSESKKGNRKSKGIQSSMSNDENTGEKLEDPDKRNSSSKESCDSAPNNTKRASRSVSNYGYKSSNPKQIFIHTEGKNSTLQDKDSSNSDEHFQSSQILAHSIGMKNDNSKNVDVRSATWKEASFPKCSDGVVTNNVKQICKSPTDDKCVLNISSKSPEQTQGKCEKEDMYKRNLVKISHSSKEKAYETKKVAVASECALENLSSDASIPMSEKLNHISKGKKTIKSNKLLHGSEFSDTVMKAAGAENNVNLDFNAAEAYRVVDGTTKKNHDPVSPSVVKEPQYDKLDLEKSIGMGAEALVKTDASLTGKIASVSSNSKLEKKKSKVIKITMSNDDDSGKKHGDSDKENSSSKECCDGATNKRKCASKSVTSHGCKSDRSRKSLLPTKEKHSIVQEEDRISSDEKFQPFEIVVNSDDMKSDKTNNIPVDKCNELGINLNRCFERDASASLLPKKCDTIEKKIDQISDMDDDCHKKRQNEEQFVLFSNTHAPLEGELQSMKERLECPSDHDQSKGTDPSKGNIPTKKKQKSFSKGASDKSSKDESKNDTHSSKSSDEISYDTEAKGRGINPTESPAESGGFSFSSIEKKEKTSESGPIQSKFAHLLAKKTGLGDLFKIAMGKNTDSENNESPFESTEFPVDMHLDTQESQIKASAADILNQLNSVRK